MAIDRDPIERAVQAHYRTDPDREWQRMDHHRTEFAVTLRALDAHLPPAPARILDCGGGPGRYAIALTQRGYDVVLFDLSPELLALAEAKAGEVGVELGGYEQGTATDLSRFGDATFDGVLLMGPLYHLLDERDRRQALSEACRVTKPGGPVFAAFISRYAAHIDAAACYPDRAAKTPELFKQISETGLLPPSDNGAAEFVAYFAHPSEVQPLCERAGLELTALLGVEGVVSGHEALINTLTGSAWETWVDTNYQIAHDATTHGGVEHLLAVCHRPRWRTVLIDLAATMARKGLAYTVVGGAALALHGLRVCVRDLDLEMSRWAVYQFQEAFAAQAVLPVAWRETETVRSHYGRFEIGGVQVDVMADLERHVGDRWAPSLCTTSKTVELQGMPIQVVTLEEEVLANLRRGRLETAAMALPHCDRDHLLALWKSAVRKGFF